MSASVPSLIVLARRAEWERLRTESAARALMLSGTGAHKVGSVAWIPLDDFVAGTPICDAAWRERLQPCAAGRGAPMVVVWCQDAGTPDGLLASTLASFGDLLIASLQQDRTPPRLKAIIHISPAGLQPADARILQWLADDQTVVEPPSTSQADRRPEGAESPVQALPSAWPLGLRELRGPSRRPVYLMSERTRVDRQGRAWPVVDVWPPQVARLLAAIENRPNREGGLRGWRAIAASPSTMLAADLERETYRHVRRCLESAGSGTSSVDLMRQERPDTELIDASGCPSHCRDINGSGLSHPQLPDWWALDEQESVRSSMERLDDSGSLRTPRQSLWYRCFRARGERFTRDRLHKAVASLEQVLGRGGLRLRIWQVIHRDAAVLPWIAEGQFQAALPPADDLSRDLARWESLVDADEAAARARRESAIKASELDLARDHFMGVGWRLMCALAGCLFISTVFATMMPTGQFWIAAIAAAAGGVLSCVVIGWLEQRAGRRAANEVERDIRSGEAAIADGFYRRVALGAEGDLRGRVLRWSAACSHVRQCAQRLRALCELSERRVLKSSTDGLVTSGSLGSFHAASSFSLHDALSTPSREAPTDHPDLASVLQRSESGFEHWWSETLAQLDPARSGSVPSHRFTAMLDERLDALIEDIRPAVLNILQKQDVTSNPSQILAESLQSRLGPSGDFSMIGAPTLRARGHALHRVVSYLAPSDSLVSLGQAAIQAYVGSAQAVSASVAPVDRWGMLGLFLDEITLTIVSSSGNQGSSFELLEGDAPDLGLTERSNA